MTQAGDAPDEELMVSYRLGDFRAFEVLYLRHSPKVWNYLGRRVPDPALREDIFQAIFLKLHSARSKYDSQRPFLPWLFTISRTVMIDALRSKRMEEAVEPGVLDAFAAPEPPNAQEAGVNLSGLTPAQKEAIELRYVGEKSFAEIAQALKISPGNARQLVSRGVRALRALLPKGEEGKGS